jgi:FkbM family methyltransferase
MTIIIKYISVKIFYALSKYKYLGDYYLMFILMLRKIVRKYKYHKHLNEVELIIKYLNQINKISGILFDIGASTGSFLERYLNNNWNIYAFEPDPNPIKQTAMRYFQKYFNVTYVNNACSNISGQKLPFFTSNKSTGISSLHTFDSTHNLACYVETITLTDYMAENNINQVTVLKIDTEGHDYFVLQGFPWEKHRPSVIMCEFENKKTIPLGYGYKELGDYLMSKGYKVFVSEWFPLKDYGEKHKWKIMKQYPADLDDSNSFGNFICFRNDEYNHKFDEIIYNVRLK